MSQRTTLQVLAALFVLCLSYAPSAMADDEGSPYGNVIGQLGNSYPDRIAQPGENEAGTYWWIKYFQCMVQETQGGADWATAGEACEALEPGDTPNPSDDPQVPDGSVRLSARLP